MCAHANRNSCSCNNRFSQVYRLPVSIFHFVPCDQKHSRTFDLSTTHLALAHHEITLRRVSVNRFDRKSVTLSFLSRRWTWVEKHRSLASLRWTSFEKVSPCTMLHCGLILLRTELVKIISENNCACKITLVHFWSTALISPSQTICKRPCTL